MNPKVDAFLRAQKTWRKEFTKLREIILSFDLTEELKWGQPCYSLDGKNVILMHGFKEYCAVLFHKGALLKDPEGILIQQTKNVQAARQIRFTSLDEVRKLEKTLKAYIREAIEVEKSGLKVPFKRTKDFDMPEELESKLDENAAAEGGVRGADPGAAAGLSPPFRASRSRPRRGKRGWRSASRGSSMAWGWTTKSDLREDVGCPKLRTAPSPMNILAVSGSLKPGSHNHALLEAAASAAPAGVRVVLFHGLRELPPFDPDVAPEDVPAVARWRDALRTSDALLVASPEYGFSLPGVLKNAIDWVIGTGELERKVVAITASVPMAERGRRGLDALRVPLCAVSARIVGGRPIVRGPGLQAEVAALVRAAARAVERGDGDRPHVEFWFELREHLLVSRRLARRGVARRRASRRCGVRSCSVPIFQQQGWNDSPFNIYPAKGRYMWRDLERVCADAIARCRCAALRCSRATACSRLASPWPPRASPGVAVFVRAVFHANFAEDRDIASTDVIGAVLGDLGLPVPSILARAMSEENKAALRRQTERAEELGIFGAPTFVVDGELFWGNDRLEPAIDWARSTA